MLIPAFYSSKELRRSLYEEKFELKEMKSFAKEMEKNKTRINSKWKMALANLSVPALLTAAEHLAYSLGVNVASVPWQYVITSAGIGLTYALTKKYASPRTAPLHTVAYLPLNLSIFDFASYLAFGLREGKFEKIGEWARSTFHTPVTDFLSSSVCESFPVPWFYLLSATIYGSYVGLHALEKKFHVVRKIKDASLKVYDKIYDSYQKSRWKKYLVRMGMSATFTASGTPLLVAAPLSVWAVMDGIETIRRKLM